GAAGRPPKTRSLTRPRHRRVLVMSAGTGATNNLVRGLRADPSLGILGCQSDPFFLKKSSADANFLLPSPRHPAFARALRYVVERAEADLVIPTTDEDVRRPAPLPDRP